MGKWSPVVSLITTPPSTMSFGCFGANLMQNCFQFTSVARCYVSEAIFSRELIGLLKFMYLRYISIKRHLFLNAQGLLPFIYLQTLLKIKYFYMSLMIQFLPSRIYIT